MGNEGELQPVQSITGLQPNSLELKASPEDGCSWEPTYELTIPDDWPSGWYRLEMPAKYAADDRNVDFIVAESQRRGDVLYVFDTQTALAYNVYAGASIYGGFDSSGHWSTRLAANQVSWMRPTVRSHTYDEELPQIVTPESRPHEGEQFRLELAEKFNLAYVSNDSLVEMGADYLARYPAMVIAGTQEYWTNPQIELVKEYVRQGGNLYLSAEEFAYGVFRSEQGGRVVRYFNNPRDDLKLGTNPREIASIRGLVDSLQDFFGVSLAHGYGLAPSEVFSPLRVVNPQSWVFEGLGYGANDPITSVRGIGVGAWVSNENGRYAITSSSIPSADVDVLAIAPYEPIPAWDVLRQADEEIDPKIMHVPEHTPDTTYAILALIRQGKGQIFVAPGGWFNQPHAPFTDPRRAHVIERVISRFAKLSS